MKRRAFVATVGVVLAGVAGCLDRANEPTVTESNDDDGSNDDEEPTGEESDSSEEPTPTTVIEAFAEGFRADDPEAVRETIHPDAETAAEIESDVVESVTFEITELELLEETDDEATVDVVWEVHEDDETADDQELEITLRSTEDGWGIWELEEDDVGEAAQAAVDVQIEQDAQKATITVTSMGNADGVYVHGDTGDVGSCSEPVESAGDVCEAEGEGTYAVIAYIGAGPETNDRETVIHSFEIDG